MIIFNNNNKKCKTYVFTMILQVFVGFCWFFVGCSVKSCQHITVHSKFDDFCMATGVLGIFFHAHAKMLDF